LSYPDLPSFPTRRSSDLISDVHGHADHQPPAVGESAEGGPMEIPDPRLAASGDDAVLALVDAAVQVVQPLDVRFDQPFSFTVGLDRKSTRLNSSHLVISY